MTRKSLIKSASIISSATLLSRLLGFVRDVVMAGVFGTGWIVQAFFVAFRIPNMFRELAAEGASNAAFIPVFSQYLATKEKKEFWKLVNTVFVAFVLIVSSIVLAGIIFSPLLVRLIAPGFIQAPEKLNLTIAINRPLFGYLILVSVATFLMGVLYTFKSFFSPSFSPVIFNIVLIASIMFADNSIGGIWKVVIGVLIAGTLQIIIQLPAMFRNGFKLRPFEFQKNVFSHPGVKLVGRLLLPRVIGTALYQLNVLIDTIFASLSFLVGPGAIAAIYYSTRLIQFPLGVFGHSISNASLPTLSELAAKGEMKKFSQTVEFGLTNILFIMIPAGIGLVMLSRPIVKLVFQRGSFDQYSTTITSVALAFYAVGLAAYGANKFLSLSFNALHNTVTPVKASAIGLVINIVLNTFFTFVLRFGIAGLALASSISAIISCFILYNALHRRISQIDTPGIINQTIKMLAASAFMALVIFLAWGRASHSTHHILALGITIGSAIIAYIFTSFYLKIYQSTALLKWVLKKN